MGLLDTIRSLLGLGGSTTEGDERRETTVSVEREADAETEAAVKGTGGVAAGTDATASTETLADEADASSGAAEPGEATGPGAETPETELDTATAESEGETTAEHEASEHEGQEPESVEAIKGIGPAYAERLSDAGVDTVTELADADAAELAAAIDLSEKRVGSWIERARDH